MWKAFKDALLTQDIEVMSPLESLRNAFQMGWIDDEAGWIQILKDRNLSAHVYREELAAEIYGRIRANAPRIREAYDTLAGLAP